MQTGVQFTGTLQPNQTINYYTWGWNPALHVVWYVMPTTPRPGSPELEWTVRVERGNATQATHWISVHNLAAIPVTFEGRYAIL
jgi:hypothetical protein